MVSKCYISDFFFFTQWKIFALLIPIWGDSAESTQFDRLLFSVRSLNPAVMNLNLKLSSRIKPQKMIYQYATIIINMSLVITATIFKRQTNNTN